MNGEPSQQQERSERNAHARFVECLERHAGDNNGRAVWSNMASELGWTVEQVQSYAHRYMLTLNEATMSHGDQQNNTAGDVIMNNGDNCDNETNGNSDSDEWTLEEDILLDSLLAAHLPCAGASHNSNSHNNNNAALEWEEQVASRLPGRTPMQVRQRYNQLYGDRGNR